MLGSGLKASGVVFRAGLAAFYPRLGVFGACGVYKA